MFMMWNVPMATWHWCPFFELYPAFPLIHHRPALPHLPAHRVTTSLGARPLSALRSGADALGAEGLAKGQEVPLVERAEDWPARSRVWLARRQRKEGSRDLSRGGGGGAWHMTHPSTDTGTSSIIEVNFD